MQHDFEVHWPAKESGLCGVQIFASIRPYCCSLNMLFVRIQTFVVRYPRLH